MKQLIQKDKKEYFNKNGEGLKNKGEWRLIEYQTRKLFLKDKEKGFKKSNASFDKNVPVPLYDLESKIRKIFFYNNQIILKFQE